MDGIKKCSDAVVIRYGKALCSAAVVENNKINFSDDTSNRMAKEILKAQGYKIITNLEAEVIVQCIEFVLNNNPPEDQDLLYFMTDIVNKIRC